MIRRGEFPVEVMKHQSPILRPASEKCTDDAVVCTAAQYFAIGQAAAMAEPQMPFSGVARYVIASANTFSRSVSAFSSEAEILKTPRIPPAAAAILRARVVAASRSS